MQNETDPAAHLDMPPCITREQAEAWLQTKGTTCPHCGAEDDGSLGYDSVEFDGNYLSQYASCSRCGGNWKAAYRLDSLYDTHHGNHFDRPEFLPEAVTEVVEALKGLIEWASEMGGWEAPVWDRARAALAKLKGEA